MIKKKTSNVTVSISVQTPRSVRIPNASTDAMRLHAVKAKPALTWDCVCLRLSWNAPISYLAPINPNNASKANVYLHRKIPSARTAIHAKTQTKSAQTVNASNSKRLPNAPKTTHVPAIGHVSKANARICPQTTNVQPKTNVPAPIPASTAPRASSRSFWRV